LFGGYKKAGVVFDFHTRLSIPVEEYLTFVQICTNVCPDSLSFFYFFRILDSSGEVLQPPQRRWALFHLLFSLVNYLRCPFQGLTVIHQGALQMTSPLSLNKTNEEGGRISVEPVRLIINSVLPRTARNFSALSYSLRSGDPSSDSSRRARSFPALLFSDRYDVPSPVSGRIKTSHFGSVQNQPVSV